ncbi:hypothetical protein AALM99_00730 [Lactococcus muris]|uniref:Uncharacterized protein n=1 Tax=Lactococcus muris TaxID=2941330 RepID=A0ABV4D7N7_9LACT|nr:MULTISPECIES: hypothetical protein [Lactococcus]
MKLKIMGLIAFIVLASVIAYTVVNNTKTDSKLVKARNNMHSEVKKMPAKAELEKKNLAIQVALEDFKSLNEFNERFSPVKSNAETYTPDEHFMIPDTTQVGKSAGKERQWLGYVSKDKAQNSEIKDINTGKVEAVLRVEDGATTGEIRTALATRDTTQN